MTNLTLLTCKVRFMVVLRVLKGLQQVFVELHNCQSSKLCGVHKRFELQFFDQLNQVDIEVFLICLAKCAKWH